MASIDRAPQPVRHGGGRTAVLAALGLSLGLHGAAFGAIAWFWEAVPAAPVVVFAVELIEGEETGPQPGTQQTASAAASDTAPSPRNPTRAKAAKPADPPALADSDSEPETAMAPSPPESPRVSPAVEAAIVRADAPLPAAELALPAPPPLPRAKPAVLLPAPQPIPQPQKAARETARPTPAPAVRAASLGNVVPTRETPSEPSAGGLDTVAVTAPRYRGSGLANPAPRYPYLARRRGQEGRVILRARVSAEGEVEALSIAQSSGYHLLDEAALKAVRQWRFLPARKADLAVAGLVEVPVSFRLTD